jgi:hypothetical protein
MNDYISRADAVALTMQYCPDDDGVCSKAGHDLRELVDDLENAPPADVRPVARGEWIMCNNACVCSNCGNPVAFKLMPDGWHVGDFCTKCGADMRMEIKD